MSISDELVKSHIPYVVHASTKPVLSEPSTLRPFDRSTGSRLTAQGERWVEALSTNGISIGYPALRGIHPEPFLRLRSGHSETAVHPECVEGRTAVQDRPVEG